MTPEEMQGRLLYRDGLMLIIDKPAGLAVHKGPKSSKAAARGLPSLEDYFDALRFGLPRPPVLAHRLDKDTSGCLVLGRHRKATANLNDLFRTNKVNKTYWAVVEGGPAEDAGQIDMPLGRLDDTIGWWMKHDPNGLPSQTTWKVMGRFVANDAISSSAPHALSVPSPLAGEGQGGGHATHSESEIHPPPQPSPARGEGAHRASGESHAQQVKHFTWLALEPITGRTHQLRVHCSEMGWPIFGDAIYGNAPRNGGPPMHLHAREIEVPLYKNKAPIKVAAPVPAHMRALLKACGWNGEEEKAPAA
jgi:tRNA pseudouridine32 synthase/23S rRNA pseudouridine746 synthase